MRIRLAVAVLVGLLVAADDSQNAANKDLQKLAGTWKLVSAEENGKEVAIDKNEGIPLRLTFKGNQVRALIGNKERRATVKIDPSEDPKNIDIVPDEEPNRNRTRIGIYRLEGDTLTICINQLDNNRPKGFTTKNGSGLRTSVYKREKKTPGEPN